MNKKHIPIIDLFAGPGGLGEGFSSVVDDKGDRIFKIALSIERDPFAHQTLTLRSFLRQFPVNKFPEAYYQFLRGEIATVEELFMRYPAQAIAAKNEAWKFSLGDPANHDLIDNRIKTELKGEKDFLLIGGPPCQAYSLVGRARRQEKQNLNKEDERVYLYREYYRILAVHQPSVFIMENVKGLLSSKVENESVFSQLLQDLKNPVQSYHKLQGKKKLPGNRFGYKIYSLVKKANSNDLFESEYSPKDFIIRAEEYGIPQTRHRVILLGVREDISIQPETLVPSAEPITVADVLKGLPSLRSGLSKEKDGKQEWKEAVYGILGTGLKKECDLKVWQVINSNIEQVVSPRADRGEIFLPYEANVGYNADWYLDKKIKGITNHQTRSHIRADLWRYMFVASFANVHKRSPKLNEFPLTLLPKHKNATSGDFANRFKAQLWNEPSKTITSHISKDGHYFIHPDAKQCRSLTVREAARIQTFPDNYYFCGPRTEQFHQVGNAVPPLLANKIGNVVMRLFSR